MICQCNPSPIIHLKSYVTEGKGLVDNRPPDEEEAAVN